MFFKIWFGALATVLTALSVLGFVLAFTTDPSAISMGIGCAICMPIIWIMFYLVMTD
jgi:hypothetical protein